MRFREHRGGLDESLRTTVVVKDRAALVEHCAKLLEPFPTAPPVLDALLKVKYLGFDERCLWDTHIVTLDGYGVLGFTDGQL